MKSPKNIIDSLYLLFSTAFILTILLGSIMIITIIVSVSTGDIYGEGLVSGSISIQYDSLNIDNKNENFTDLPATIKFNEEHAIDTLKQDSLIDKSLVKKETTSDKKEFHIYILILRILFSIILIFFPILILRECKRIFDKLGTLVRNNEWFSWSLYKSLKSLFYYILALSLFVLFIDICTKIYIYVYDFKGTIEYQLDVFDYIMIIFMLFIFVIITAVYKAGVVMREEQDLII